MPKVLINTLTNSQFQDEVQNLSEDELRIFNHMMGYFIYEDDYIYRLKDFMRNVNYYGVAKYSTPLPSDTDD
jgi:hypothetical protein